MGFISIIRKKIPRNKVLGLRYTGGQVLCQSF